jgi:uncharacterized protein
MPKLTQTARVTCHFKMTPFKYLSFLFVFIWTVNLTASCKIYSDKAKTKDTQVTSLRQEHFQDTLPRSYNYVNDFESLFSESEKETLESLLQDFEKRTSIQVAILTIDTSMTTKDSLEAFTLKIGNSWGVGQKDKNNGVVIGISQAYRKMSIQNGYGIEKMLSDAETKEIIDTAFIPSFRDADYFKGTLTGLKSLIKVLEERYK